MLKTFLDSIPGKKFWLANLIFWLALNTIAASHSYRMSLHYERPSVWFDVWLEYLPWWGNWAIVAPLIIASTRLISFDGQKISGFIIKSLMVMIIIMTINWGLTIIEVAVINTGSVSFSKIVNAIETLMLSPLHMDFLVYLAVLSAGYSYSYYERSRFQILQNEKLSKQLIDIELQSLKSQLDPHFLFNTLNTIASLIRLDMKSNAVKALSELSLMLRKVLENNKNQLISLDKEIEFITSYLTIQKMRFENKLDTKIEVGPMCSQVKVPFMLLQPLVENAVQHGSQLESNKNMLNLNISCTENHLLIKLINKIPEKDEHKGFGIGLNNCKQRLEILYEDNFELSLTPLENGYFETYLSLPKGENDD